MNKLRVGVVGVGHIGKNHARLYAESEANFAAIYDTDAAKAGQVAQEFGVPIAASLDDFAARVDAASVATPTGTHFEIARELLARGKHLLIEKPITENPTHATQLAELAAERQLVLQVGHVERFNPVLSALEERLTHPRFIEAHRLSPYPNRSTDIGVVLDLMIHDLEIILHLVRSPVQTIDAVGVPVLSRSEDIANARLRFEDGCVANITSSRISPERMRKIRVFQEDAYLSLDYGAQSGEIFRRTPTGITKEPVEIEPGEPLKRQLLSFLECAATGRAPKVSGLQATAALELAVEITRRISEGRASARPHLESGDPHLESASAPKMGTCGSTPLREEMATPQEMATRPEIGARAEIGTRREIGRQHPIHLAPLEAHNRSMIVFVTACTAKRRKILASPAAHDAVTAAWKAATTWLVGRYVIMPDHIHFFCSPNGIEAPSLEKWIRYWKSLVTRALKEPGESVWQRHHWDRQLRRGESYSEKWAYVCANPVRHGLIADAAKWPYQGELNVLRW